MLIVSPVESAPQPFLLPRFSEAYADFTSGTTETFRDASLPTVVQMHREGGKAECGKQSCVLFTPVISHHQRSKLPVAVLAA